MLSSSPRRRDFVPTIRVYFTPNETGESSPMDPPSAAAMESAAIDALDKSKVIEGTWRWIAEDTAQVTLERIGEAGAVIENADGLPLCDDVFTLRLAYAPATDKVTLRNIDDTILAEDDRARRENPADPPHLGLLRALGLLDGSHGSVAVEYFDGNRGMGRLRFENAERAAEFVARAQAKKVEAGHSRVLYVDYDYGPRPGGSTGKKRYRHEGSCASEGEGEADASPRDRRAARGRDQQRGSGYTRRDQSARSRSRGHTTRNAAPTRDAGRRRSTSSRDLRSRLTRRGSEGEEDQDSPKRARHHGSSSSSTTTAAALSSPLTDPSAMSTFMQGLRGMMGIVEQVIGGGVPPVATGGPSVAHNGCGECGELLHRLETHLRRVKHTAEVPFDDVVKRTVAAYLDAHYEFEREDGLAEGTGWELTRRERFRNEILNPFLTRTHFREWGKLDPLWTKWFPTHILGGSKSWDVIRFRRRSREDQD